MSDLQKYIKKRKSRDSSFADLGKFVKAVGKELRLEVA
jgi:hypothetical protein